MMIGREGCASGVNREYSPSALVVTGAMPSRAKLAPAIPVELFTPTTRPVTVPTGGPGGAEGGTGVTITGVGATGTAFSPPHPPPQTKQRSVTLHRRDQLRLGDMPSDATRDSDMTQ